jgi:methyltransferase (TIGR00027 family)
MSSTVSDQAVEASSRKGGVDTISTTAKIMATVRVLETEREVGPDDPPRLFSDPLAAVLAGPEALERTRAKASNAAYLKGIRTLTVRTKHHDDAITKHRNVKQIVILGAGLDTRAYRLTELGPDDDLFEIDTADIIHYKNDILASNKEGMEPKCKRHTIATDLSHSSWAEDLGKHECFQKSLPTVWILEGLIYYLTPDSVDELMSHISNLSSPGSILAADIMNWQATGDDSQVWNTMWKFGCDDPVAFLEKYGWDSSSNAQVEEPTEAAKKYAGYEKDGVMSDMSDRKEKLWFVMTSR